jgi:hypothetical protein
VSLGQEGVGSIGEGGFLMAYAAKTNQFEDNNLRNLIELLGQIHTRETALPDFQRDFVWDPPKTQELIVSIAYYCFVRVDVSRVP